MAQEELVNTAPKDYSGDKPLQVRRGRVESVDLYEITDSELELLEKGSPVALYLNFAVFLVSIAFSALVALCTTITFKYEIMKLIFVVITIVGTLLGGFLFILWRRGRADVSKTVEKIRGRIPPDVTPNLPSEVETKTPSSLHLPQKPAEPKG